MEMGAGVKAEAVKAAAEATQRARVQPGLNGQRFKSHSLSFFAAVPNGPSW